MLKSLRLRNFRGFVDHTVEFAPFTLLTGQNNAGKTTIIEAIRIISAAQSRVKNAKFLMAPSEFDGHVTGPVFKFSLKTLDFDEDNIHHNYQLSDPAIIIAKFKNNTTITVFLGADKSDRYSQFLLPGGKKVNSGAVGSSSKFCKIFVMPPIGSLLVSETERSKKYLRENINGYLSYRHIRNQMFDLPAEFSTFTQRLEETWDHLQVEGLELVQNEFGSEYHLNLRDGRYPAEVGRVGSGLQAWIQTLWFLARVDESSIIVLDEPDVYLHADLQKKLVRVLGAANFRQTVVATHSIEMISDVSPDEIVEVRKKDDKSQPISTTAEAQAILYQMGTSHHLQLSKLANCGKVLFLEGKDHQLLGMIASKMGSKVSAAFESVPRFAIGGMSNWKKPAMTAQVLWDTSGGAVKSILLIDRDYFSDEYLDDIVSQAATNRLRVQYWCKKEIENYFIDADAIFEHVQRNSTRSVSRIELFDAIDGVISSHAARLPAQIAQQLQMADRKLAIPTAMERAQDYINERCANGSAIADLVPGKQVVSEISSYCQDKYQVSFSATTICRSMDIRLVPSPLLDAIKMVCGV